MSVRYERHGRVITAARIVSLRPPDAWHLDRIADEFDETGDYKLTRIDINKTRLSVTFRVKNKSPAGLTRSAFLKSVNAGWDKYVAVLESDYRKQARLD